MQHAHQHILLHAARSRVRALLGAALQAAVLWLVFPALSARASFTLNWVNNDTPSDENGFIIQRSVTGVGGPFVTIDNISDTTETTYQDLTANDPTVAYAYRVYAYNSSAQSTYTNVVTNAPTFTIQPVASQNAPVFGSATFTATAVGIPAPTYQWEVSADGGNTWTNLSDGANVSGSATSTLTLSNLSEANAVTYAVVASNGAGAGTTSTNSVLNIVQASQTISFGAITPVAYSPAGTFILSGTASSGLPVSYVSSNLNVATVSGNTVTIVNAGTTYITASQSGNEFYLPAATIQEGLLITPAPQTITFSALPSVTYGGSAYTFTATSSSGLPVTFSVSSGFGIVTVTGNTFTINAAGNTGIAASQTGNSNYQNATSVVQNLVVNKAAQTITFGALPVFVAGASPYMLVATASSGLPVSFSTSNGGVGNTTSTDGATLVISASSGGTATITAFQSGNNNYNSAPNALQTLQVNQAPIITNQPGNAGVNAGNAASFSITANAIPSATYQWEVSTDGGNTWTNLSNGDNYSGVTTTQLLVTGVTLTLQGDEYLCVATNSVASTDSNAATLTVKQAPSISSQPVAQTGLAGGSVTFTAVAVGGPAPNLQWQVSTNGGSSYTPLTDGAGISGSVTGSLTLSNLTAAMNGYRYGLVANNNQGEAFTTAAVLTVDYPPTFSTQPVAQTTNAGSSATFTIAATGNPTPTYQWQVSTNGGTSYTALSNGSGVSGATGVSLTLSALTAAMNGNIYQAVATNSVNAVPSNPATLTVDFTPAFLTQPVAQTANAGASAVFSVATTGNPAPTYQWQVSTNGGTSYTALSNGIGVSGATAATLSLTNLTAGMNGNLYKVVASNSVNTVPSNPATLTVDFTPAFSTQPSTQTANAGASAIFSVATTGNPAPTYQWQVSTNGGTSYSPLSNGAGISGATSASLTLSNLTVGMNGYIYEVVASNGLGSVTSTPQTLTVDFAPAFSTQPAAQTANAGTSATFTAAATGNPAPGYQWKVSTNGGVNLTALTDGAGVSGSATASLTLSNLTAGMNGYIYEVVASNGLGSVTSTPQTLTVDFAPAFSTQPAGQTASAGNSATFTAATTGNPAANYQWQVSTNGGSTFSQLNSGAGVSGATTASLTLSSLTAGMNGYLYEVVASNGLASVTSTPQTLTVDFAPAFSTQPTAQTANAGNSATFTAATTGNPAPGYQWKFSTNGGVNFTALTDGTGVSGSATGTLTLSSLTAGMNGYLYEVVASNGLGSVTSTPQTLTVDFAPAFSTQPTAQIAIPGASATFTAVAAGNPVPTCQWEVSTNGSTYTALTDGAAISGSATASLTLSGVSLAMSGNLYEVTATNSLGSATSNATSLTVAIPPSISSQPVAQTVVAGSTAIFAVTATGTPVPTYQWQFGGINLTGATNASLTLTDVQAANVGNYGVVVSNVAGQVTSNSAALALGAAGTITQQPVSVSVPAGGSANFTVTAIGNAVTYQWNFNGTAIAGATNVTLNLTNVQAGNVGNYTVTVSSNGPTVTSGTASLSLLSGMSATHAVNGSGFGYVAGQNITITNTINTTGTVGNLGWSVLLPTGWSFVSATGSVGQTGPNVGATGVLDWTWTSPPASPATFTYTLSVPASTAGSQTIVALVSLTLGGNPIETLAQPDPLMVPQLLYYSSDEGHTGEISLTDLTRAIELYNTHNGSTRTGAYTDQPTSEDGFAPNPTQPVGQAATLSYYYTADENQSGVLSLSDLTRVIELYNYHNGSVRTGQYHPQWGTEDGFAPGP